MNDTDSGQRQQRGLGGGRARALRFLLLRRCPPRCPHPRPPQPQPGRVEPRHEGQHGAVEEPRPPAVQRHRRDQLVRGARSRAGRRHLPRDRLQTAHFRFRQAALEITARYCRNEMEQYGRCVAASPTSWQTDCHSLRLSMSRCAATHPIVQRIREDCAEPFVAFEQCLKENQASVLNCSEHVNAFLRCAERVKLPA